MTRVLAEVGGRADTLKTIEGSIRQRTLDAGAFLIRQGDPAPQLYMICEGLVKMFYITADGKEFVKSFIAEGQFTGSLAAQVDAAESTFSVVCLEPVKVESIPFKVVQGLIDEDPKILRFFYEFFFALALKKEKREYDFLCQAPQTRYRQFVDENPNLVGRVTQADIARYLGITPVALSRIRGRAKASKKPILSRCR